MASTAQDKRAQETARALRLDAFSLMDSSPKSNSQAPSTKEVATILDGFQLILNENMQESYHSYLFDDYLEAAC